ncbi:MAG TPA: hypothetical protein VIL52_09635 [Bacteroidota bacterium]
MKPEDMVNALQQEISRMYGSLLSVQQALESFDPESSCNERVQSMKENLSIIHSRLEGLSFLVEEYKKTVQSQEQPIQEEPDLWM